MKHTHRSCLCLAPPSMSLLAPGSAAHQFLRSIMRVLRWLFLALALATCCNVGMLQVDAAQEKDYYKVRRTTAHTRQVPISPPTRRLASCARPQCSCVP